MSKLPNAFSCLHMLAKRNNYDVIKWRDLLVSVYRKSNEKHTLKDTCLLYYALARGYKNGALASLQIKFKVRNGCCGNFPVSSQLHIGINDVVDAYMSKLSVFINFMNAKQLSMVTHSLSVLNRFNGTIVNKITSRIDSTRFCIPCRSLATMALTMAKSKTVSTDFVERMLLLRLEELLRMNCLDLVNICKALSLTDYSISDKLCDLLSEKIHCYASTMNSEDTIVCLNFLSKSGRQNEKALKAIFFRISNTLEHFSSSLLLKVVKSLTRLKSQITRDFCDLRLVSRYLECYGNENDDCVDEALSFIACAMKCGSNAYPGVLHSIMPNITTTDEWSSVFNILYMYEMKTNELLGDDLNSITQPGTNGDISELWSTAFKKFTEYVENNLIAPNQCINVVHWSVKSGRWDYKLFDNLMNQILRDIANVPISDLVNLLHNLYYVTFNTAQIEQEVENRLNELDAVSLVKFVAAQFSRGKRPPFQCVTRLCGASTLESSQGGQDEWEMPFNLNENSTTGFGTWKDDLSCVPLDLLSDLLDSIATFVNKDPNKLVTKKVLESRKSWAESSIEGLKQRLVSLLQDIITC